MARPDRPDRDQAYVEDILDSARAIALVSGATLDTFSSNEMLIDAVIRRLAVVGESPANLSQAFRDAHPHEAWKQIVGLRNFIVHKYWALEHEKLWLYATIDVPRLASYLTS